MPSRLKTQPGDLVLITGITGRIGANLAKALLDKGYRVRGIALPGDPQLAKLKGMNVEVVQADLRDVDKVKAACADVDAIAHLAALMGPDASGDMPVREYWSINVDATLSVLEGARCAGNRIVKFLFASTDATYPAVTPKYSPIDEDHPQDPVNMYGLTKVVGERMCKDYMTEWEIPITIVRYGGVSSPNERSGNWLGTVGGAIETLKMAKVNHNNYLWANTRGYDRPWEFFEPYANEPDKLVALTDMDGRPWKSQSSDVRDMVQGNILALESEAAVGEAFNIVGPTAVTWEAIAKKFSEMYDKPYMVLRVPFTPLSYEITIAKARLMLGYNPQYDSIRSIDDGVKMRRGEEIGVIPAKV